MDDFGMSVDVALGESTVIPINAAAGTCYFFRDIPGHEAAGLFSTLQVWEAGR